MASGHSTGMRGVFLVAAELAKRGFIVSPTSRGAAVADLLVTDSKCRRAYTVQVKTNRQRATYWLTGKETGKGTTARSHIYVLVNLEEGGAHEYYVVPSKVVRNIVKTEHRPNSTWYGLDRRLLERYRDGWGRFGMS